MVIELYTTVNEGLFISGFMLFVLLCYLGHKRFSRK